MFVSPYNLQDFKQQYSHKYFHNFTDNKIKCNNIIIIINNIYFLLQFTFS